MNIRTRLAGTTAIALACAATAAFADDDSNDSFRELSAQWWQWALSIPVPNNPLIDSTGANCMVGQRGPVWFLAGSVLGVPVTRSCTIPEGVKLFFPVLNNAFFNSPGCEQENRNFSVAEGRALVAPAIAGATGLSVKLDNRAVHSARRVRSEVFATVFPSNSIYASFGVTCIVPGYPYSPSVDDGYYVKLPALSVGQHHLKITGTVAGGGFSVDVDYLLNVVKVNLKDHE